MITHNRCQPNLQQTPTRSLGSRPLGNHHPRPRAPGLHSAVGPGVRRVLATVSRPPRIESHGGSVRVDQVSNVDSVDDCLAKGSHVSGGTSETATFAADVAAVRDARRFVVRVVTAWDAADPDHVALLTSELATNAVIHAGSTFTVTVRRLDGAVRVDVADASAQVPRRRRYSGLSGTGRGLGLVEDVAEVWGVDTRPEGKSVWFVLNDAASADDDLRTHTPEQGSDVDLDALLAELGVAEDESLCSDLRIAA
jgi:anti-sigma regulatory factor (Ser/Thr protein kinase)